MFSIRLLLAPFLFLTAALAATAPPVIDADSRRGGELLRTQGCTNCHTIDSSGASTPHAGSAPDLTRRTAREYSAAGMASRIWNHAPAMWSAMGSAQIAIPKLTATDSADLMAFFYAARYFENPGDAGRGKRLFDAKHCAACHGLDGAAKGDAKPVSEWESLADPIQLVQRMWIHSSSMRGALEQKHLKWPTISGQELTDILVFVQNMPANRHLPYHFVLPGSNEGQALLISKGCGNCHMGSMALERRLVNKTLTDVAASMWNHSALMTGNVTAINSNEMRQIVIEMWAGQFFTGGAGDSGKGQKVYTAKCGACHAPGGTGAPAIPAGQTAVTMVSNLWTHGPNMLATIRKSGGTWPRLNPEEMTDLVAYLGSRKP